MRAHPLFVIGLSLLASLPAVAQQPGYYVEEDGIVTWRLPLKPGEKRTVDLAFHVDAPSSYDTGGM